MAVNIMVAHLDEKTPLKIAHFGTVQNPISMMEHEHGHAGKTFKTITRLTNNYTPPADAFTTYSNTFSMLEGFEKDLHVYIYL